MEESPGEKGFHEVRVGENVRPQGFQKASSKHWWSFLRPKLYFPLIFVVFSCPYVRAFVWPCVRPSPSVSVRPSVRIRPAGRPSVRPPARPFVPPSLRPPVRLSPVVGLCPSVRPSFPPVRLTVD